MTGTPSTPGDDNNGARTGLRAQLAVGYPPGPAAYFAYLDDWRSSGRCEGLAFR